ncbi:MAG: BREX-2 system adenine-specific DNA-methyltransferase PglX [Myxococcaceae bacterium]|nr:BREX-2 system adenine-specific DNA-methyltransferase PglX [Myxococcaceae bacterium]
MGRETHTPEVDLRQALVERMQHVLVPDLLDRARDPAHVPSLSARYQREFDAGYTQAPYEEWLLEVVEQVGASWLVTCAVARALESQGLVIPRPWSAKSPTEALSALFRELAHKPGTAVLFGAPQNALWLLPPSDASAEALIRFFWGDDSTESPGWRDASGSVLLTLFEDLYQDLSQPLRERHALLSTPSFVVDFILERTLEPALNAFGLTHVRLMDPVCGAGGFLLRAFEILCAHHQQQEAGGSAREQALAALAQVHGVDIAPLATLITRARLTLAFLMRTGISRLEELPALPLNIVAADSLLRGFTVDGDERLAVDAERMLREAPDTLEPQAAGALLRQRYHVVVGNPPFISVPDSGRRRLYRERYVSAHLRFTLSAPFIERFFQLAVDDGFVGLITSPAFMKREFGRALVEQVLPRVELTNIVDASGAYLPGHGVPTVFLLGRNRSPRSDTVHVVLGKRAEPTVPLEPAKGRVWLSLTRHLEETGYEDEFIQVAELSRESLKVHPWTLAAGHSVEILRRMERQSVSLGECAAWLGQGSWSGADGLFLLPEQVAARLGLEPEVLRPLVLGESLRHWAAPVSAVALAPYRDDSPEPLRPGASTKWGRYLWPYRLVLAQRPRIGSVASGDWWSWSGWRVRPSSLALSCPRIASHNHFAAMSTDKLAGRSVLTIQLRESAEEEELLLLLAYLNSSVACFWLKQHLFRRTLPSKAGDGSEAQDKALYDFSPGVLRQLPVPTILLRPGPLREQAVSLARRLDQAAREREASTPRQVLTAWAGTSREALLRELAHAQQREVTLLMQMVSDQEDLDWLIYGALELAGGPATHRTPGLALPEHRPFNWLSELPPRRLQPSLAEPWALRRRELLHEPTLALLETSLYKRSWRSPSWGATEHSRGPDAYRSQVAEACREWLLERLEKVLRSLDPPRSVPPQELLHLLLNEADAQAVASLYNPPDQPEGTAAMEALFESESAPCLAALRYTASGLVKREGWERAWACQRAMGEEPFDCPAPLRYTPGDFLKPQLWLLRGPLDVPRERFILYPGAESEKVYGWAGWDFAQRAHVLMVLYAERKAQVPRGELIPLLGGMLELLPWVEQWHPAPGTRLRSFIHSEAQALETSLDVIRAWRPGTAVFRSDGLRGAAHVLHEQEGSQDS